MGGFAPNWKKVLWLSEYTATTVPMDYAQRSVGGLKSSLSGIVKSYVRCPEDGGTGRGYDRHTASPAWVSQACAQRQALLGTLIVASRSTSAQSSYDFNEFLSLLEPMLKLVLLGFVPSTHFGKELHRAKY